MISVVLNSWSSPALLKTLSAWIRTPSKRRCQADDSFGRFSTDRPQHQIELWSSQILVFDQHLQSFSTTVSRLKYLLYKFNCPSTKMHYFRNSKGRMLSRTESFYFRPDNTLKKSITVKVFKRTERKVTNLLGNCYRNPLSLYN